MTANRPDAIRILVAKVLIFCLLMVGLWFLSHYLQTVVIPDRIAAVATRQTEASATVSTQMRTYQTWQNLVDPLTWLASLALFAGLFLGDLIKLAGKRENAA